MKITLRDISFYVDDSFKPEFWKYINSGNWESDTFDIIDNFVTPHSFFVDLGCWAGPLSLYAAKKGAYVYAIDPDPEAYNAMIENIKLNSELRDRIKPQNIAISNTNGEAVLHARAHYGNSSTSLLFRIRDCTSNEITKTIRLENFLEINTIKKIDLLKIDIEGGEFQIIYQLENAKKKNKLDIIFLSIHYDHLNEFLYQNRIKFKFISFVLMKLERVTGIYLFKKKIVRHLTEISTLSKKFKYVYSSDGKLINQKHLTRYLLQHKPDLLLTDVEWNKHEITKPKLH